MTEPWSGSSRNPSPRMGSSISARRSQLRSVSPPRRSSVSPRRVVPPTQPPPPLSLGNQGSSIPSSLLHGAMRLSPRHDSGADGSPNTSNHPSTASTPSHSPRLGNLPHSGGSSPPPSLSRRCSTSVGFSHAAAPLVSVSVVRFAGGGRDASGQSSPLHGMSEQDRQRPATALGASGSSPANMRLSQVYGYGGGGGPLFRDSLHIPQFLQDKLQSCRDAQPRRRGRHSAMSAREASLGAQPSAFDEEVDARNTGHRRSSPPHSNSWEPSSASSPVPRLWSSPSPGADPPASLMRMPSQSSVDVALGLTLSARSYSTEGSHRAGNPSAQPMSSRMQTVSLEILDSLPHDPSKSHAHHNLFPAQGSLPVRK